MNKEFFGQPPLENNRENEQVISYIARLPLELSGELVAANARYNTLFSIAYESLTTHVIEDSFRETIWFFAGKHLDKLPHHQDIVDKGFQGLSDEQKEQIFDTMVHYWKLYQVVIERLHNNQDEEVVDWAEQLCFEHMTDAFKTEALFKFVTNIFSKLTRENFAQILRNNQFLGSMTQTMSMLPVTTKHRWEPLSKRKTSDQKRKTKRAAPIFIKSKQKKASV